MIYLQLFISFLQIGMFSFGGGYAAMPLIQGQVVTGHKWLTMAEFTDLITISQMTPGPIAVNSATFVGTKIAGVPGAFAATLGCILPSCVIVTLIAKLYLKYRNMAMLQGMQSGVGAVIASVTYEMGAGIVHGRNKTSILIMVCAFAASCIFRVNVIFVVIACGLLGVARTLLTGKETA